MEIKHEFENVTGDISLEELEIISVPRSKHATVDLCIRSNMNIPFARIKLYSGNLFIDAATCFGSAKALGKEIEMRWQLKAENDKLKRMIDEIEDISCGEKQVADNDSEGMGVIYKLIQALKG